MVKEGTAWKKGDPQRRKEGSCTPTFCQKVVESKSDGEGALIYNLFGVRAGKRSREKKKHSEGERGTSASSCLR